MLYVGTDLVELGNVSKLIPLGWIQLLTRGG